MSTESTLRHYPGRWKFRGETLYDFDEIELLIDGQTLHLVMKFKGLVFRRRTIANQGQFVDDFLVFRQAGPPAFFVRNATKGTMLCGELAGTDTDQASWWIQVRRLW